MEVKEYYQVKISNRSAPLKNLYYNVNINRTWEVLEYKTSATDSLDYYEFKQHKQWFHKKNAQNY